MSSLSFEDGFRSARLNDSWRTKVSGHTSMVEIHFNNGDDLSPSVYDVVVSSTPPEPTEGIFEEFGAVQATEFFPVNLNFLPAPVTTPSRNGFVLSSNTPPSLNERIFSVRLWDDTTQQFGGTDPVVPFQDGLEAVSTLLRYDFSPPVLIHSLETTFETTFDVTITHTADENTVTLTVVGPDVLTGISLGGVAAEDNGNGEWVVNASNLPKGTPIPVVTTHSEHITVNVTADPVLIPRNLTITFNNDLCLKSSDESRSQIAIVDPGSLTGKEILDQNGDRLTMKTNGIIVSDGLITMISVDNNFFETNLSFLQNRPEVFLTQDTLSLKVDSVQFSRFVTADGTFLSNVSPVSIPIESLPPNTNMVFFENENGIRSFGTTVAKIVRLTFTAVYTNGVTSISTWTEDASFPLDELKFSIDGVEDVDGSIALELPPGEHDISVIVPADWFAIFKQPVVVVKGQQQFNGSKFLCVTVSMVICAFLIFAVAVRLDKDDT